MNRISSAHIVLLQKGWQAGLGLITALLVTYFLTVEEQGYYFAIGSLLSGYVLLDLGLSTLLVQISARMFAGLEFLGAGDITPAGLLRSAFIDMVAWSRQWYIKAGFVSLILFPIGYLYFSFAKPAAVDIHWQLPWLIVVISIALSFPAYPALSIVEGTRRVAEVYWVRIGHYSLGALMAWTLLAGGLGLYAPAMASLSVAMVVYIWFWYRYRSLFTVRAEKTSNFCWQEHIWPLQHRVAISWLAGYLILYSPTLIVFYFTNAAMAGRLGLSIVVANMLGALCISALTARVPLITHLTAEGRTAEAKKLFLSEFRKALFFMLAGYVTIIFVVTAMAENAFVKRVLPPFELTLLFALFVVYHSFSMNAIHYRARGKEVLALPAMISTVISIAIACVIAASHGVSGVLFSFLVVYGVVCLSGMFLVWRRGEAS